MGHLALRVTSLAPADPLLGSQILKLTDKAGVNVVIDFIGASYLEKNVTSLARDGRMVLLGLMGGAVPQTPFNMGPVLFKRLRIEGALVSLLDQAWNRADCLRRAGTTLRSRTLEYQSNLLTQFSEKALPKIFSKCNGGHGLDLVIHKVRRIRCALLCENQADPCTFCLASHQVYNWDQIIDAHNEMEEAKNVRCAAVLISAMRLTGLFARADRQNRLRGQVMKCRPDGLGQRAECSCEGLRRTVMLAFCPARAHLL